MQIDQVKKLSHELRLFGIHENAEHRAMEAMNQGLHPLEFIRILLEDEKIVRKRIASKRLISRAKFRHECDLEDWDDSFDRGLSKAKLKELALMSFYKNKENLLILGRTGEGKTHLGMSLGKRLCLDGVATAFYSVNLLFEEIQAAKIAGSYLKLIKKISKTPVLILDDFALRNYSHDEATSLMDILEEKYQKGVLIVTSQVDPKGWQKLFEDQVIAEAIVDRLTKPSQKVKLSGGSYRGKQKRV